MDLNKLRINAKSSQTEPVQVHSTIPAGPMHMEQLFFIKIKIIIRSLQK